MRQDFKFRHQLRVRFGETDAQKIVFNANYLLYCDIAWTEYFRELGLNYEQMIAEGCDSLLARTTLEFRSSAAFDEILEVCVRVVSIGNTSMTFEFEIYNQADGRLVNRAQSLYVFVDPQTMQKRSVPENLRLLIAAYQGAMPPAP